MKVIKKCSCGKEFTEEEITEEVCSDLRIMFDELYVFNCDCKSTISVKISHFKVSKKKRKELYEKQPTAFDNLKFCPENFICYSCKDDILRSHKILKDAIKGIMITGCPFCKRSYCD